MNWLVPLHKGKELLENATLTCPEIAWKFGFASLNLFFSSFYKEFEGNLFSSKS